MILGGFPEQLWLSRPRRAAFLILAFAALATNITAPPEPPLSGPAIAALMFEPVTLDESAPSRRQVGSLHYLGGWALSSDSDRPPKTAATYCVASAATIPRSASQRLIVSR